MRTIRTFILRLLVDPAEPGALRGAVQAMPGGEALPFANGPALLTLLEQMSGITGQGGVPRRGVAPEGTEPTMKRSSP